MNVAEVMTASVATCRSTDSLNLVAQLMWERRCGCIPVIDEAGALVGVLTDRDACMGAYTQGRRLDDISAATAMSRPVRICSPLTTIGDAEDLMMAHGVHQLVVVEPGGGVCGVLSLDDIARAGAAWDGRGEIDLERVALTLGEISRRTTQTDEEVPEAEVPETDITGFVQSSLAVLKTLRDEIRADINLAGKEARDRWPRLEARLRAAETDAHEVRVEAARNLASMVENAREFRTRLRDKTSAASQAR
jgi:CBS domain-containing protein